MKNNMLILLIISLFTFTGCNAAINMNGKVMGISSGQFTYQDGNLISNYRTDIDSVWKACEKIVKELNGRDVQVKRSISRGEITSVIQDEKVVISVEYVTKDLTSVAVFVGIAGNNMASRLIHEKIAGELTKH